MFVRLFLLYSNRSKQAAAVLMLLDVIIWLPTLFTYVLFLLILLILFFIVAYVSHKIYISIYDNLPLPAAPGRSFSKSLRSEQFVNQISARSIWIPNRSTIFETTAGK